MVNTTSIVAVFFTSYMLHRCRPVYNIVGYRVTSCVLFVLIRLRELTLL